jgi:hypothetical protein
VHRPQNWRNDVVKAASFGPGPALNMIAGACGL